MANKTEMSRMNHILELLKKENRDIDEFELKRHFKFGVSTYNQIKREAKLDPLFNGVIEITSVRGQPDRWRYRTNE